MQEGVSASPQLGLDKLQGISTTRPPSGFLFPSMRLPRSKPLPYQAPAPCNRVTSLIAASLAVLVLQLQKVGGQDLGLPCDRLAIRESDPM